MADIRYYNTDIGGFTIIVDDEIYAALVALGNGRIVEGGTINARGLSLIDILSPYDITYTLLTSTVYTTMNEETAQMLNTFAPLASIRPIEQSTISTTSVYENHAVGNSDEYFARIRFSCNVNNEFSSNSWYHFETSNTNIGTLNSQLPIGILYTGTYFGGTEARAYICGFTVAKADLSDIRYVEFTYSYSSARNGDFYCNSYSAANIQKMADFITNAPAYVSDADPYGPGGVSTPGGGEGTFDDTSVDVDIPALPSISATSTGFITLYAPTLAQINQLASYMWSDVFDLDTFKKLFTDPMGAILGLSIVPVNPSVTSQYVKLGNVTTEIVMGKCDSQWIEIDCGSLNIQECWGAYLDYAPYTKAELYLPYIGTHPIDIDDIMAKTVTVKYHVDILSGACVAYVKCGGSVLYNFIGQCASSIPVTGDNWQGVINGALNIAGQIGGMVATGGASAPMAVSSIASTAVNTMKPQIEKSGSLSGTGGLMGVQTPYLIITRPRQCLPDAQNSFIGYPSYITVNLSDISGYTVVDSIHIEGVPATGAEMSELESILKSGVIF